MSDHASSFDRFPNEQDFSIDTFDDYGIDGLGDAFDSFDRDFDW